MTTATTPPSKTRKRTLHRLSKATVDRLVKSAEPTRETRFYFAGKDRLYMRVLRGRATFGIEYRRGGRIRRLNLGTYGSVTIDAIKILHTSFMEEINAGKDPAAEREAERRAPRPKTFREAGDLYLADLRKRVEKGKIQGRRSTLAEWTRLLGKIVYPKIGRIPIATLDKAQVKTFYDALDATPATANRALTVVVVVVRHAVAQGWRPFGPSIRPEKGDRFPEAGRRDRLSEAELTRLGTAMREAEEAAQARALAAQARPKRRGAKRRRAEVSADVVTAAVLGIRLCALTGMRRSEVFGAPSRARAGAVNGLTWGDVLLDPEMRCIRLRAGKTGPREVPLGRAALDLLAAARPADVDLSAPVVAGRRAGTALVGVDRVRRALFEAAGIVGRDLHSLRHAFASVAADLAIPEVHIRILVGHRVAKAELERYLHAERKRLLASADAVSGKVAALLDDRLADVLPYRAADLGR